MLLTAPSKVNLKYNTLNMYAGYRKQHSLQTRTILIVLLNILITELLNSAITLMLSNIYHDYLSTNYCNPRF